MSRYLLPFPVFEAFSLPVWISASAQKGSQQAAFAFCPVTAAVGTVFWSCRYPWRALLWLMLQHGHF